MIYYRTEGKDELSYLEPSAGDTIDIYEWLEFEFYDLVWFWNNQSYDTKPMLVQWIGISHWVVNSLCYWIVNKKGKVISCSTVQHLTADKLRDPNIQERIRDYHGSPESGL